MDPAGWNAPFPVIVTALFFIVLLRTNATYWLGRLAANGAHRTRVARWMDSPRYLRAVEQINRWGAPAVSLSFLTIGLQTLVNLAAGATKMPLPRYVTATVIGSVAWAFLYGTIGFVGFEALSLLWERSPAAAIVAGLLIIGCVVGFVLFQLRHQHTADGADRPGS